MKDDSMKMTCHADGVPKPTYTIKISNGMVYKAGIDGMVVVKDYESIVNASYTCIAKNSVGQDKWHLNGILTVSKGKACRIVFIFFRLKTITLTIEIICHWKET